MGIGRGPRLPIRRTRAERDDLFLANMALVPFVARSYLGRGAEEDDLMQMGYLGLLRACEVYDEARGVKFSAYACWWIRQQMGRALCDRAAVRVGRHALRPAVRAALRRAAAGESLSPRESSLAATGRAACRRPRPLALPVDLGDPRSHDAVRDVDISDAAHAALRRLPPRARRAVELRFGLGPGGPSTLREVGAALGVSAEYARRILDVATRAMYVDVRRRA